MSVTNEDFQNAVRVVALKQSEHLPLMQDRFPLWADKIEYWDIDDVPGVLDQVEKEVMSFVARILGGGQPEPPSPEPKKPVKKVMTVKVGRETAGRRGKGVVTIFDVPLDENGLRELAGLLKQRCGTGGTVKDGRIEIQGDQRERVVAELERLGYQVKRVGG
jgi:predicted translation initiation factor SUI1